LENCFFEVTFLSVHGENGQKVKFKKPQKKSGLPPSFISSSSLGDLKHRRKKTVKILRQVLNDLVGHSALWMISSPQMCCDQHHIKQQSD
jgi:hypothetical protein